MTAAARTLSKSSAPALYRQVATSLEFERAKRTAPAFLHKQLELRFMTRAFNRRFQPRSIAELQRKFNQPIFDVMERREPIDPATLPLLQQAAIMQMHESHFARTVYRALLEDSQDKPTLPDYRALVDLGLAQKGPADKWHKLTFDGASAARNLEKHLCRKLDIHGFIGPRGTGHSVSFHCPCGWRVSVRNSPTAPGNAAVSWRQHHVRRALEESA